MRAGRHTNLGLLALLTVAATTGALAYGVGTAHGRWIVLVHGVAGLGLLVLAPWKSLIVRRGWAADRPGRWISALLGVLAVATVGLGVTHAVGWRTLGPVTAMQLHVGAALALLPVVLWHVRARPPQGPRRSDLSRRGLLRAAGLLGAAGLLWGGLETALAGATRRFTGSLEVGSHDPPAMPVTQWLDDDVPVVDTAAWRLTVVDGAGRHELGLGELRRRAQRELVATLDCTGGWYAEQRWRGLPLDELLVLPGDARSILVRSVTGYARRYPAADAGRLLVATGVGGRPLSPGHGGPARIVAPGRRGFWWVKWLDRVRVSSRPWWWQPPFPLT